MVTKKTKSGIEFSIDERIKDDARLIRYLVKIQNKKLSENDKMQAVFDMIDFIFGSGDGADVFMAAVAEHHDGICSVDALVGELREIFTLINAKN